MSKMCAPQMSDQKTPMCRGSNCRSFCFSKCARPGRTQDYNRLTAALSGTRVSQSDSWWSTLPHAQYGRYTHWEEEHVGDILAPLPPEFPEYQYEGRESPAPGNPRYQTMPSLPLR